MFSLQLAVLVVQKIGLRIHAAIFGLLATAYVLFDAAKPLVRFPFHLSKNRYGAKIRSLGSTLSIDI